MALTALIFDVDGTLADTERDGHRIAFNAAFKEFGVNWEWSPELYGELLAVTGGKERMKHYVDFYNKTYQRPADFDAQVAAMHKAKTRHYTQFLAAGGIPMRPGVKRLLDEARAAGLRLAIATTTTMDNVTALLEHSLGPGSQQWFEVIGAGDVVPEKKPAPDIYLWVLDKLKVHPAECLAFEDSENGLRASRGAGLATVITTNDYTAAHDFSGALAVLSDFGEPGAPLRLISGDAAGKAFVDVELLRYWHAQASVGEPV